MRVYFIWLSIILVLSLFQAAFLPLNLALLLVLLFSLRDISQSDRHGAWLTFWSGLIFDLSQGLTWGTSSLIFVVVGFLFRGYSRRFDIHRPFLLAGFILPVALVYQRLVFGSWSWWSALALAILAILLRPVLLYFQDSQGGIKLKY